MDDIKKQKNPYEGREGLIYARVSSKRQEKEGSGLDSQESRCLADLNSLQVKYLKTFPDSFTGGGDFMRRPAMRAMIEYIDAHPHKKFVVVFDDLSRLARDVVFHLKLRATFKARDVVLRCLNYDFDDSPEGEYLELITAGGAQLQRKVNRRTVIQRMKARLDDGYWPFGSKKGYYRPKGSFIPVATRLGEDVLRPALEGFASGKFVRKIDVAKFLCEHGFWKGKSPEKYLDRVSSILTDPFYCGRIFYPDWEVESRDGKHTGLISAETFERIQKRLKKGGVVTRIRADLSEDFPLRGVIVCSACNGALTGCWTKGRREYFAYYFCQRKGCSLRGKTMRKLDVERDFESLLQRNALKSDVGDLVAIIFSEVWKEEALQWESNRRNSDLAKVNLKVKIDSLAELARRTQSEAVLRVYEQQIEEVSKELTALEQIVPTEVDISVIYQTALDNALELLNNPLRIWKKVSVLEKRRLFFFLFDAKLPYTKSEGYQTGNLLSTTRLFEEITTSNTIMSGDARNRTAVQRETHTHIYKA